MTVVELGSAARAAAPTKTESLAWSFSTAATEPLAPIRVPGFALPTGAEVHRYANAFSASDCDAIMALANSAALQSGGVHNGFQRHRNSRVAWLAPDDAAGWIYKHIERVFANANEVFGFALDGVAEMLQFAQYDVGGHFDWHIDCMRVGSRVRKMSLTIQLSDPADYDGGALEFQVENGEPILARPRGTAIVFPAFNMHRVTPVARGRRCALVAWAVGPMFR